MKEIAFIAFGLPAGVEIKMALLDDSVVAPEDRAT